MKILILSNLNNEEEIKKEDELIANSFLEDDHEVKLVGVDYNQELESEFEIIIKRNTWDLPVKDLSKYNILLNEINERLEKKNKPRINFTGKFDSKDKGYLVELYDKGYKVVPSIDDPNKINKLGDVEQFLLKPKESYDGYGQITCNKNQISSLFKENYIIQPKRKFKSEIQFYFINREFQYAFEFAPSKVPIYPDAVEYKYTDDELKIAQSFADLNDELNGIQRIDFLKLNDNSLELIEIEDASPYLDLDCLDKVTLKKFLSNYKNMVYNYLKDTKNNLIAPCGMNCALCLGYQRDKNKCNGCRNEANIKYKTKHNENCVIKNCDIIKNNNSGFCYECQKFPCKRLKDLDKRYKTKYSMSMIENLNNIKQNGVGEFVVSEDIKWKCNNCDSLICVHRNTCLNCGNPITKKE